MCFSHMYQSSDQSYTAWKHVCHLYKSSHVYVNSCPLCVWMQVFFPFVCIKSSCQLRLWKHFFSSLSGRSCQSCVWKHLPVLCMKTFVSYVSESICHSCESSCSHVSESNCHACESRCQLRVWKQVSVMCLKALVMHVKAVVSYVHDSRLQKEVNGASFVITK